MFSCNEVLARHSDYLDGVLPADDVAAVRAHIADCTHCSRYDRVLRRGLNVLVREEPTAPDPDFLQSLHSRLAVEDQRIAMRPVSVAMTGTLSIAAMLVLVTWLPAVFSATKSGATAVQPVSAPDVSGAEIAWHAGSAVADPAPHTDLPQPAVSFAVTSSDISLIDRGYSPLILEAPTAPPTYINASLTTFDSR